MSDDLLQQVLDSLDPPLPENDRTLQRLRSKVNASAGADPSLLELSATNGEPARAAQIANTWAEQYVEYVNELYGRRTEDVVFFGEQFEAAQAVLEAAEGALVDFEAGNQQSILQARLKPNRRPWRIIWVPSTSSPWRSKMPRSWASSWRTSQRQRPPRWAMNWPRCCYRSRA